MRVSPYTYGSAYAACGFLFLLAPPAAIVMGAIVTLNLLDELRSNPEPQCWQPDEETGLETLYACKCHERMGNDFWFLPRGSCLYGKKDCHGQGK